MSFPSVRLIVGPFTEQQCRLHGLQVDIPHVERCELVRHCRWVDDVILDAPVVLDENFLARNRIDYVAVEEGSSVDPAISKERLAGYDLVKSLGMLLIAFQNILCSTITFIQAKRYLHVVRGALLLRHYLYHRPLRLNLLNQSVRSLLPNT